MDRANIDRFNLNSSFKELLIILGKPAPLIDAWKDKGLLFRSVRWYLAIKLEKGLEIMSIHAIFAGDDERESMTSLKIERALCKLDGEREW